MFRLFNQLHGIDPIASKLTLSMNDKQSEQYDPSAQPIIGLLAQLPPVSQGHHCGHSSLS